MSKRSPSIFLEPPSLTIAELESGLRCLDENDLDQITFWDEHINAFKQTVLIAIRDTSDALLSPGISAEWRLELEAQLPELIDHLELVNRYVAARFGDDEDDLAGQPVVKSMVN